jgi:Bacterial PH domain
MALPPLSATPHVSRLLAPDEVIIYTAKLHPLHGWPWLLGAGLVGLLGLRVVAILVVPAFVLGGIYLLAFRHFEMAVTTRRLLLRWGRFGTQLEGILPEKLEDWRVQQSVWQSMLHAGTLTLRVKEGRELRVIALPWVWHPLTLVEALETLQLVPRKVQGAGPHDV